MFHSLGLSSWVAKPSHGVVCFKGMLPLAQPSDRGIGLAVLSLEVSPQFRHFLYWLGCSGCGFTVGTFGIPYMFS